MHGNMVQKTKFYFIILAAITTLSLSVLMFKWATISKVYKITSHETHVHIQQLPAIDKPFKVPAVRHLEVQLTTTHKPGSVLDKGNKAKRIGKLLSNNTSNKWKEDLTTSKPITTTIKTTSLSPSSVITGKHTTLRSTADPANATFSFKALDKNETEKSKTVQDQKETLKTGNSLQESNENQKVVDLNTLKDLENRHNMKQNAKQTEAITDTVKVLKEKEDSKHTSSVHVRHKETLTYSPENDEEGKQIDDTVKTMKDKTKPSSDIGTTDNVQKILAQSNGAQSDPKPSKITENADKTHETEKDKKTENSEKETNKIVNEKNEKVLTPDKTGNTDFDKTNKNLPKASKKSPTFEMRVINDSFIKEKLLMNENSPSDRKGNQRKTENQTIQKDSMDGKVDKKDPNVQSNLEKGAPANDNDLKLNDDKNQFKESTEKPKALTSKVNISDDYNSRRQMVEKRLKNIKEQLINRTIMSDVRKDSSKEKTQSRLQGKMQNNKVERKGDSKERNEVGPVNRYLQQRLRYLGLRNRMNPMFNNMNNNNPNIDEILKHEGKTSRPDTCKSCFPMDFRKIIDEENTCKGTETEVLILISTSPQNKEAREAIRATWGKVCQGDNSKLKYLFVLGNASNDELNGQLKKESDVHHDMIQVDFKDSYANLTYKTMMGLKWANEYCENAKYVMKTDDDMYLNTELLPLLIKQIPQENFLGGFCWGPSPPHRDMNSKWYVSYEMFRSSLYPSMCSGTGYILSSNIIPRILATSRNIPFFYLEDVYLAICLNKVGLHPTSIGGFNNQFSLYDRCDYKNNVITSHQIDPDMLKYYWSDSRLCDISRPSNMTFSLNELY